MSKSTDAKRLMAAASFLALAACTTVGPDFQRPAGPETPGYAMKGDALPSGYALTPEDRAGGAWWTGFGSPELDAAIRQAFADSPTIEEALATLERSQAEARAVEGGQGLQSSANAAAVRERINTQAFGFTGFPSPTISLFSVGAGVSYDLDLFGGQRRAREEASARIEAARRRADAAYLTLSGQIALQAVEIASLRAEMAAIEEIVAEDRQSIEMVRRAEAAGGAAPSAKTAGEAQLAQDLALLPPLERDLAAARHQMALLVGKAPADWTAPEFELSGFARPGAVPVELPSTLVRTRPDILAAEADLHASTAAIGVATADLYPKVTLGASLTQSAIHPGDIFSPDSSGWTIGPSVKIPLFDRAGKARRDAAVAAAKVSLARYKGVVLRAFIQVSDALVALAHDEAEIAALVRAEQAAEASVRDARAAYRLGGGPAIEVIEAQRQVSVAKRQRVRAEGRYFVDLVRLKMATGAAWQG